MKKSKITIQSKWFKDLDVKYIENESDTLVVVLPGGFYTVEAPLLYYSVNIGIELGYDVIPMIYGSQAAKANISDDDYVVIASEIIEVIKKAKLYKRIIVIAKSMGTSFIPEIKENFSNVIAVYLTPVSRLLPKDLSKDDFYVYGTNDSLIKEEDRERIKSLPHYIVENGSHSLQVGSTQENIQVLSQVMAHLRTFLTSD